MNSVYNEFREIFIQANTFNIFIARITCKFTGKTVPKGDNERQRGHRHPDPTIPMQEEELSQQFSEGSKYLSRN